MKSKTFLFFLLISFSAASGQSSWIRINQLGYLIESSKTAVFLTKENIPLQSFELRKSKTNEVAWSSQAITEFGAYGPFSKAFRLDFSWFTVPGRYYIQAGNVKSPVFAISNNIYNGSADFLLRYMRQQQCGYNPFSGDSCHTHDGFIIYHPEKDSAHIDATGGWHDASDYLQYVTTSATAVYQLLFAYKNNPKAFGDKYDKNGDNDPNEIPDILDAARWGMDWLLKMNPGPEEMYNQIADDRDHAFFRKPSEDPVDYGKGKGKARPVYLATGKPQGVFKYKNRTTGIASTAGKFASAFALGSEVFKEIDPKYAALLLQKSKEAYAYGKKNPGVCQTAPCVSPYFYEEDNWTDDMELAAAELFEKTGDQAYLKDAVEFGRKEPVTPWMGADTARHYQWFPFINLGHYILANSKDSAISQEFISYMKRGLDSVYQKAKKDPFMMGIPFIWCSNNLVSAMASQAMLYRKLTGDRTYEKMEGALRDWLLGCNPWGTSMITGFPAFGVYPKDPHAAFSSVHKMPVEGGLVDGPVYSTIFKMLKGLTLTKPDQYADVQPGRIIFHDDWGDYSTNEPTMDGTAGLAYFLSGLQSEGHKTVSVNGKFEFDAGGLIRLDRRIKEIRLVFTGHNFADGAPVILNTLKKNNVKASFFFTGDFYREKKFEEIIRQIKSDGHYLGAHSDKHLLYASWTARDSLLVTKEEFAADVENNYKELKRFGVEKSEARYFMPPYEWYNKQIADWTKELGLTLINFTPGTRSNGDYTIPEMGKKYYSSQNIYESIMNFEQNYITGLNGFILLTHIGTDPSRKDKFYNRLDEMIVTLKKKGYRFVRF